MGIGGSITASPALIVLVTASLTSLYGAPIVLDILDPSMAGVGDVLEGSMDGDDIRSGVLILIGFFRTRDGDTALFSIGLTVSCGHTAGWSCIYISAATGGTGVSILLTGIVYSDTVANSMRGRLLMSTRSAVSNLHISSAHYTHTAWISWSACRCLDTDRHVPPSLLR